MEHRLQIFVSSSISELSHERYTVKDAIESFPLMKSWIFEYTPASTDPLEKSYLGKVRESDLFVLLLGRDLSESVCKEWQIAVAVGKPRLVFIKKGTQGLEAQAFLKTIDVKWREFTGSEELEQQIKEAVADELIKGYRHYRLQPRDLSTLGEYLERLVQEKIAGETSSSKVINIDNRSGGVYIQGTANIKGDILGGNQAKNIYKNKNRNTK